MATALEDTGVNDGGLLAVLDGAAAGASGLESLDDLHGLVIRHLAEDDVAAIEPAGLDSSNKELRAVAIEESGISIGCHIRRVG